MRNLFAVALLSLFLISTVAAQAIQTVPFSSSRWTFEGNAPESVIFKGKEAMRLNGTTAVLGDVQFLTGTIEFDIAFPSDRNFLGVMWSLNGDVHHQFYFRPHQSGKPDANQYQPMVAGVDMWQLYHGEHYSVTYTYPELEWMNVRLVIGEEYGDVYLDSTDPVLTFKLKENRQAGAIGLFTGQGADAYFANLSYRIGPEETRGDFVEYPELEQGMVSSWSVSDGFEEAEIDGEMNLPESIVSERSWRSVASEEYGIADLSHSGPTGRTVIAALEIDSDAERIIPFKFGYSDRVRLFLNGRLLYSGDNGYRTRDFRYLGTIGLFDSVTLALERGSNDLMLVVSEDFGGWGVIGKFDEHDGIRFERGDVKR